MHLVDGLNISALLEAPLWEELLTDQIDEVSDVLVVGKVHVLPWVVEGELDFVHKWSAHGED